MSIEIKQPKFKFGDRVKIIDANMYGDVYMIWLAGGGYKYQFAPCYNWFAEENIELHQEPKKKKLYAFIDKKKEVRLFEQEDIIKTRSDLVPGYFERAPIYDIEYPEDK
jgi:hypothetical protein